MLRQQVRQLSPPDSLQCGAGLLPLLPCRGLELVACLIQLQLRQQLPLRVTVAQQLRHRLLRRFRRF